MSNDALNNQVNPKILITEDHAISMLLAKTLCKVLLPNAIIIEASNGKEAVEVFLQTQPNLILMDVNMPEMSGYEATQAIRYVERGHPIPIIGVSAGMLEAEKKRCLASGMNDYLHKPVLRETLGPMLGKWLPAYDVLLV